MAAPSVGSSLPALQYHRYRLPLVFLGGIAIGLMRLQHASARVVPPEAGGAHFGHIDPLTIGLNPACHGRRLARRIYVGPEPLAREDIAGNDASELYSVARPVALRRALNRPGLPQFNRLAVQFDGNRGIAARSGIAPSADDSG